MRAVGQRHAAVGEHGGALGRRGGQLARPLQPATGRGRAAGLQLDEAELAADHARTALVAAALGERQRLVQHRRPLLVAAADRVDERRAERGERLREQGGVADAARLGARLAQARDARLDGAGVERGAAGGELADRRGAVAGPGHVLLGGRAPHARVGRTPQLAPEAQLAGVRVLARRGAVARPREAAHEQLVRALVVRVERDRARGERRGLERRPRREPAQRGVAQHALAHAREPPPLDEQPRLEHRAGAGVDALEQLAAGQRRIGLAREQREHVHLGVRRQAQLQRVPAQRVAERAPQLRERPPERAQRVVGVGEDQVRELRAADPPLGQQQVGQDGPGLVAPGRRGERAVALDLRPSQQSDGERRHRRRISDRLGSMGWRRASSPSSRRPGSEVRLSNPAKVYFPRPGWTKLDLAQFYLELADAVLVHVRERPTVMKRFVNGIQEEPIWQKRVPQNVPEWLQTATVSFPSGRTAEELVANDAAHLVWAVNLGVIDFNPWPARRADLDHPDELRVDLDPTPGVGWDDVRRTAMVVRDVLEEHGLRGYPKTSGSKGIHVNVRIEPRWDSLEVRRAALALAREVERRAPDLATSKWWKEERHGVFVDYNQNARDRTVASCYSVRPTVGRAGVLRAALGRGARRRAGRPAPGHRSRSASARSATPRRTSTSVPGVLDGLLDLARRDEEGGLGDAPWPPHFPKQRDEPKRVQPSRDRDRPTQRGRAGDPQPGGPPPGIARAGCSAASAPSPGRGRGTSTSSTTDRPAGRLSAFRPTIQGMDRGPPGYCARGPTKGGRP